VWRCFCFCRGSALRFLAEPNWRDARISKPGAWGRSKREIGEPWRTRNIFGESARSVRQRAYATCPTKQNASAPNTVADTRCATGARRRGATRFPSAKSLVIPTAGLCIRCTGRIPVIGIVQHAGSAKPNTSARRRWLKRWRLSDIRRRIGLPGYVSGGRTHASYALVPRIGSKRPGWRLGRLHKREAGVVWVTCITRLSQWSRTTTRSSWRSPAGFVKSATLRWALNSDGSLARPQSTARIAVRRCRGQRV